MTSDSEPDRRLERSLAQSESELRSLEDSYLETVLSPNWRTSLVLFGAGDLGIKALAGLRRVGIEPLAFVDNRASIWGHMVDGLSVMSLDQARATYGASVNFIVCIWRSQPVMRQLKERNCPFSIEFKALFWRFPSEFLPNMRVDRPHLILRDASIVRGVFQALSDQKSREEYVEQIDWLLRYEFESLPREIHGEQYFEEGLFSWHTREVFVDCGAFTGDTLEGFLRRNSCPHALHAFEPEPINLSALRRWCDRQPFDIRNRISIYPLAASNRRQRLRFQASGVGSAADKSGSIEVDAVLLDEVLSDEDVTFIKMDIEGAEQDAIDGAMRLIARCRPVLAICLYHRQEHLFTIPEKIRLVNPDYQLFIRRYGDQFGDIVCYAVPPERRRMTKGLSA